ncbi:RHS repeat protein, partial [Salmonella enterica]|nr:RHS repeat protein [Salmonella enterica]EDV2862405.1 RHS repeat protein [Salmonella enterica subsp. houtenae]ECK3784846.1 RHS repeat protein [Salmonella enterica]EEJ1436248.1 RHS repeat protein [Salmonella enterica subsp. houtenae]ELD3851311.1 RHS repeat protein [Salmonella enterica]
EILFLKFMVRDYRDLTGKDLGLIMHNIVRLNDDEAAELRSRIENMSPRSAASTFDMSTDPAPIHEWLARFQETRLEWQRPDDNAALPAPALTSGDDLPKAGNSKIPLPAITPELLMSQFPDMSDADRQALEYIADPENFSHVLHSDGTVLSVSENGPAAHFKNTYIPHTW